MFNKFIKVVFPALSTPSIEMNGGYLIIVKFLSSPEHQPYEVIQKIVADKSLDYVINISEQDVVIVREISRDTEISELESYSQGVLNTIADDYGAKAVIGISSIVENLMLLVNDKGRNIVL